MKTILMHSQYNFLPINLHHYQFHLDPDLHEALAAKGFRMILSSEPLVDFYDHVLFLDWTSVNQRGFRFIQRAKYLLKVVVGRVRKIPDVYRHCQEHGLKDRMVLMLMESALILPDSHHPRLHALFPVVLTWNDNLVDDHKYLKFCVPQTANWPDTDALPFDRKKLLINISSNKYKRGRGELYSERRKVIQYFEKHYNDLIDLYGPRWNQPVTWWQKIIPPMTPQYGSYRGFADSKAEVMSQYRFSVCYENFVESGYITEKIFDSMRSKCVPIYWGAPNISDYVDEKAFIDRRRFASHVELAHYLVNMSEIEYNHYQEAMQDYLAGDRFARFLPAAFADTIINALKL